jgi:dimethylamine/trimethylamine dehydrogenase
MGILATAIRARPRGQRVHWRTTVPSTFDILFEPVRIGPVVAPNRFYQVPHCNALGYRMPRGHAAMREVKAEGGWGVVCTEEVEIHHSSDLAPYVEGRLWSDDDIPALALMADAVHRHGALAGIQLAYNGINATNLYSRTPPLGPRSMGTIGGTGWEPVQSRRMDKQDIRNVRTWHRQAALRARRAGFDIVYCYAGHGMTVAMQFLTRRYNDRTDEYGGSLENRVRFLRELIEDTREAVGDRCAVAVRLAVDELLGEDGITHEGEGHDIVAMLAELPDLWDVNVSGWSNDSVSSRFAKEGYQEPCIAFVKRLTSKPVVGVGRYTSPDSMASAVRRGVLDLVGSARPSIADPFLPTKIREDRIEDIRECIGCNICVSADMRSVPIRCTQNPTMGEEWRRGWHPERIAARRSDDEILVIGAGPAGLEAARALGQRGYRVTLTEARREIGGRVLQEASLPGLNEWRRVADWRITQLQRMPNVGIYRASAMTAADIVETGAPHVLLATGSTYRRDGVGRTLWRAVPGCELPHVLTPDDAFSGRLPAGRVVIYDDDHYVMGGLLAELCASHGCEVTLVTPAPLVSDWTQYALEQVRIEKRLRSLGVQLLTRHELLRIEPHEIMTTDGITGAVDRTPADGVILVTDRVPNDGLYGELQPLLADGRLRSLRLIGDAEAPGLIAQAVFAGHLAAREFDESPADGTPFAVERVRL